jgi:hypothetical protein
MPEQCVDTKYPSQIITAQFIQQFKDLQENIGWEAVYGQLHSHYDVLQLFIDILHYSFYMELNQR